MKRNLMNILGIILIGIGTFVFLSPVFSSYKQQKNADQEIEAFEKISIHTPTKGATAILTNNFLIFCSISLINFILYLKIIQILFIFRYKFIFYFIF